MPIHDWTRVKSGIFHNFHLRWIASIMDCLNAGLLPPGFFAMAEQIVGRPNADVVALQADSRRKSPPESGGAAVAQGKPKTAFVQPIDQGRYARKANRVAIHHELGNVVAVIEIVSPGNKDSRAALRTLAEKVADLLRQGVNVLIVDLFPPGPRDPQGIHAVILDEIGDQPFELPPGTPLTLAAYQAEPTLTAYVEPVAVGGLLPEMPLFLVEDWYVNVPLEETYQATWNVLPGELRRLLDADATPRTSSDEPI